MLAKRWGVCGNPVTGYPDGVYDRAVGLGWLRALVLTTSTWRSMYNTVDQATNIAAVMTGETEGLNNDFWSDGWRDRFTDVVTAFCDEFYGKVRLIEFVNEWDLWDNEDRNAKAVEIAVLGTSICKRYGILGVLGSVASADWVAELTTACSRLDAIESQVGYEVVHAVAFHPYGGRVQRDGDQGFTVPANSDWPRVSDKIRQVLEISGARPVCVTEAGIKVGDAGGVEQQSLYVHGLFQDELSQFNTDQVLMATYFAWCDQNGAPSERGANAFGLIGEDGSLRPAYRAANYQFTNAPVVDIPVARLLEWSEPPEAVQPSEPPTPVETPTAPNEPPQSGQNSPQGRVMTTAEAHQTRWQIIVHNAVYNHAFGFETNWRKPENAWWGSPVTENEATLDDGRPVRVFANAVVAYNTDGTCSVLSD